MFTIHLIKLLIIIFFIHLFSVIQSVAFTLASPFLLLLNYHSGEILVLPDEVHFKVYTDTSMKTLNLLQFWYK